LLDELNLAFGFNPEEELINHLDGDWVLLLAPDEEGYIPATTDLQLSFTLLACSSDMSALQDGLGLVTQLVTASGIEVDQTDDGETLRIEIAAPLDPAAGPVGIYGLSQDFFFLASDPALLDSALTGDAPLLGTARYGQLADSLPEGMVPTAYVDLNPFFAILREDMTARGQETFDETIAPFQAIQEMLLAVSLPQPDVLRSSIILGLPPR